MANPYGPYTTSNMAGVDPNTTYPPADNVTFPLTPEPPFALGTPAIGTDNTEWVFVQADLPVPAGTAVLTVDANFHITAITGGDYMNEAAFAANEFGWVRQSIT